MKKNMKLLYQLMALFGKVSGARLFINFKLNKTDNIKIPGVKSPIALRQGTSDIPVFSQVFMYGEYDIKITHTPKVIIDGGANIGLFTVLMKNKFPDAKIISIEPDGGNFEMLKMNTAAYKDIFYENCGLWDKETNLKVYDKLDRGKWGMIVEETKDAGNVKAISISNIIEKYSLEKIDILKLDIETSEKKLFMANYESWLPKVKMIIVELHDFMEEGCAKPFFVAVNKIFNNYEYIIKGENTIIINNDID